ncbi:hypothetical protein D6833_11355 [Candidatus Parcubacteria bacterium]|nr:MAG: hypothetical protein D6833_11355 [Candidatus Parcubacteria bacterium]
MLNRDEVKSRVFEWLVSEDCGPQRQSQITMPDLIKCCGCTNEREATDAALMVVEILNDLHLERLIVPGTASPNATDRDGFSWPFFRVTEYGRRVAEAGEYQPYDPDGYLARLKQQIPGIDPTIIRYLEQALKCLRMDCLLAAAVMTGCAAEKALLLLIEAYGNASKDGKERKMFVSQMDKRPIAQAYRAFWKRLEPKAKTLPSALSDDLATMLDGTFNLIRRTRNAAGHPTGTSIDRETVHGHLILFPSYCRRVYALIEYFKAAPAGWLNP